MYQVLIDGKDLYYPGDEECVVTDAKAKLQLNDSGTFQCGVPPGNPEYSNIRNRISMIQVLKDGKEIFYGEVRESGANFQKVKQLYAVGELAFLFDSIQPQAEYHNLTPSEMLGTWLNEHNSQVEEKKRFYLGIVTVKDSNDSLYRYTNQETTLDAIRDKLCDRLNGYLRIRKVDGVRYLDFVTLEDYGEVSEQPIEFGENLLDYSETLTADNLYTCCIPRGAMLEESPIEGLTAYTDIKSVNDGKDYLVNEDAVAVYGWNRCVVDFQDVTVPENLKNKGENWLKDNQYEDLTLSVTAVDLAEAGVDIEGYFLGDRVPVYSKPHGMDRQFPISSQEIYLQDKGKNRLKLGKTVYLDYVSRNKQTLNSMSVKLQEASQSAKSAQSTANQTTDSVKEVIAQLPGEYVSTNVFNTFKQEVLAKLTSVYHYKGSVASYNSLPTSNLTVGDTYNLFDTGANYAWTGSDWDKLSETIDLSGYVSQEVFDELKERVERLENATEGEAV